MHELPAGTSPVRHTQTKVYRAGDGMATPDRTTARAKEAARILTVRGGNLVTIPVRRATLPNHSQPPLSLLIQVLGAPRWRDRAPSPADVIQSDDSEVQLRVKGVGPRNDITGRVTDDDDGVGGGVARHRLYYIS